MATLSATGVLQTRGVGSTILTASFEGMSSQPLRLTVAPPAVELRASPDTIDTAVGDTIALTITALDAAGESVRGVVFRVSPDTSYWAVTSEPREGSWRLETPLVLRMRANRAGRVRLTAYSENDVVERRM
ncbi:MAG: hypothetical protein HOQ11_01560 [Gemmatimonadaceae bacterium]|nr:hypothetical protein [Gemmatimonadaceae bacterium]NUQ93812.1 hypothetical protein [Gemmatimonadaceae bacterium]NUR19233.1 hypothetical protein [Gemmatimonadaceae bacterium]NUS96076.1 hypothetical protein [Gemmatimonadaceae bacterium]